MKRISGLIEQAGSFSGRFWVLNVLQMLEKLAFVVVLLQMPIYLAQKDVAGGMYLDQSVKGYIFFIWAIVQRLTPFFSGGFTDKLGYRKTLFISFLIITSAYIILGTAGDFPVFLFGIIFLGFGSGIFLPALQAFLTGTMKKENESTGWGIYFMLLNIGVFFAPPISKALKEISWEAVFYGSAAIFLINFLFLAFLKEPKKIEKPVSEGSKKILKEVFSNFFKPQIFVFVLLMSGFVIIYMQFYETFPNFFVDWVDTSGFVSSLGLPAFMTEVTTRGTMFSYEWIRIINSGLIIIAVVPVSWIMSKFLRINALIIGCLLAAAGLMLCGASMSGWISIGGILIYSLGELMTNPKFTEQMNSLAPNGKKAQYMSYLNISFALGLGGGAILGGYIYQYYGEKASLALRFLAEKYEMSNGVNLQNSMLKLQEVSGLNANEATQLLWDVYQPYVLWYPFIIIGVIAVAGLFFYSKKVLKSI
ncbi:MFS transporter [Bacteroidota bacterium]